MTPPFFPQDLFTSVLTFLLINPDFLKYTIEKTSTLVNRHNCCLDKTKQTPKLFNVVGHNKRVEHLSFPLH